MKTISVILFILSFTLNNLLAQGVQGGADLGQSGIVLYENFSTATIAASGSATNTQWTYTNASGATAPTIATAISGSITMGSNEGYDDVATKKALRIPFTALGNDIRIWTPVLTVPNSTRAWARLIIYSENLLGLTAITLGAAFDESPCDFSTVAEAGAGIGPFNLSYAVATYGEGSGITNTTYNYRIVYVDISRYSNRTGRLGFRITNPNASGSTAVIAIDGVSIGQRPTNDDCAGAYQLINGVNGPFYNTLATGLLPRCNTPTATNLGGSTLYLNPTSATTRPGDGYEPGTNGVFSAATNTVENSTWYKFTTPTLATMTTCNGGSAPTSMQVKLTIENLNCEAPANVISVVSPNEDAQQIRIFRSAFTCGSANTATTEQLTAFTTLGNNAFTTLSTASGLAYNSTYYLVIDANQGNNCRFDIKTETFLNGGAVPLSPPCTVLPIELTYFNATAINNNSVKIDWTTATERNNDYFTVERSTDGTTFHEIETVSGANNSSQEINYTTYDNNPDYGVNYYRLSQTDNDGKKKTFNIVAVRIGTDEDFQIVPNPNNGRFLIVSKNDFKDGQEIKITDTEGRVVYNDIMEVSYKEAGIEVNLPKLVSGTYIVTISSENSVSTSKIMIK